MEVSYQHSYLHLIFKVISNQVCSFPSLTLSTIPLGLFFLFFFLILKSNVIKYHKFMLSSFFSENLVLCDHGASYDDISGIRPKSRNIRGAVCWYFLLLRTPLSEIRTLLSNVNLSRVLMWHITSLYLSFLLLAMRWLRRLWKDIDRSVMPPWVPVGLQDTFLH